MSLPSKIYKNDIGTVIEIVIETDEDISGATELSFLVTKPDNSTDTWTATYSLVDSDKTLSYTTIEGDLNVAGYYYIQPYIDIATWSGRGNTVRFKVYDYNK